MKIFKRILFILKIIGTANWYQGIDKPTFWQYIYKWRCSIKTAIELDKILHNIKK